MSQPLITLDFLDKAPTTEAAALPADVRVSAATRTGGARKLYIESYGCQMNFSDSEIVTAILEKEGFDTTSDFEKADLVFLNTCHSGRGAVSLTGMAGLAGALGAESA